MEYADFELTVTPIENGQVRVRVVRSMDGEGYSDVELRSLEESARDVFELLQSGTLLPRDASSISLTGQAECDSSVRLRTLAKELFDFLLSGKVLDILRQNLGIARSQGKGLRLRLQFDLLDHRSAALACLPWELLAAVNSDEHDFLALEPNLSITRHIPLARSTRSRPLPRVLRVLIVIAAPPSLVPLHSERERARIESEWAKREDVEITFLEPATRRQLLRTLDCSEIDILHFIGHGDVDATTGLGQLHFETSGGEADPVPAVALKPLLGRSNAPRLAILNCCQSGTESELSRAYAGTASAFVAAGLPAVVAMQSQISDRAAIQFAEALHGTLARSGNIDDAVIAGRQAIYGQNENSFEWAIPVLFSRLPGAYLFDSEEAQTEAETRTSRDRKEPAQATTNTFNNYGTSGMSGQGDNHGTIMQGPTINVPAGFRRRR